MEINRPILDRIKELEQLRSPVAFNDILIGVNFSEQDLIGILKELIKEHIINEVGVNRYMLLC